MQAGKCQKRNEGLAGSHWRIARRCFRRQGRARTNKPPVVPIFLFVWSCSSGAIERPAFSEPRSSACRFPVGRMIEPSALPASCRQEVGITPSDQTDSEPVLDAVPDTPEPVGGRAFDWCRQRHGRLASPDRRRRSRRHRQVRACLWACPRLKSECGGRRGSWRKWGWARRLVVLTRGARPTLDSTKTGSERRHVSGDGLVPRTSLNDSIVTRRLIC